MTRPTDSEPQDRDGDKTARAARIFSGLFKTIATLNGEEESPSEASGGGGFFDAIRKGDNDLLRTLLAKGADPNGFDAKGDTGLILCARSGRVETARILLDAGAAPLKPARGKKKPPIEEAIDFGKIALIKLLAENRGYAGEFFDDGKTVFHRACEKGRTAPVKALIEAGIDPTLSTQEGVSPLTLAVQKGQHGVVEELLNDPRVAATLNAPDGGSDLLERSAFHFAVERGQDRTVQKMIARGALLNKKDANGDTPLRRAIAEGNAALIEMLVRNGADLNRDDAPLVFACKSEEIKSAGAHADLVRLLIRLGADPNQRDPKTGMTPLIQAVRSKASHSLISALLQEGANPGIADSQGRTALSYAEEEKQMLLVALLKKGRETKPSGGKKYKGGFF